MQGDIIYVDYERSSWKYMDDEKTFSENDVNSYKIGGNSHVVCEQWSRTSWEVQPKAAEALMVGSGGHLKKMINVLSVLQEVSIEP